MDSQNVDRKGSISGRLPLPKTAKQRISLRAGGTDRSITFHLFAVLTETGSGAPSAHLNPRRSMLGVEEIESGGCSCQGGGSSTTPYS